MTEMKANDAHKLTCKRKDHSILIKLIERNAKEGKFELSVNEIYYSTEEYQLTESNRKWLLDNGYKIKIKKEEDFDGELEDVEYISWEK